MVILLIVFLLIEMYKSDPRALLHKPTDESPFFVNMFNDDDSAEEDKDPKAKKKKSKSSSKKKA